MIRTQGNQIIQSVRPAFTPGRDVMNVNYEIKAAYKAAVGVSLSCLIHYICLASALPVLRTLARVDLRVGLILTGATAIVTVLALTWINSHCFLAFVTVNGNLVPASRCSGHALPSSITRIITAGHGLLTLPVGERLATYRTVKGLFATSIITVISTFVLVALKKARYALARISTQFNGVSASASAENRRVTHALIIPNFLALR